jgi:hypothetical protein
MTLFLMTPAFAMAQSAASGGLVPIVPQSGQGSDCNGPGGCQSICDLALLAQNVLNDGIYIAVFLSAVLFAWAGFKHLTAGGNSEEIKKANKVFSAVFIGLIIILSAWLVVNTLMNVIVGNGPTPTMPWNQICTA